MWWQANMIGSGMVVGMDVEVLLQMVEDYRAGKLETVSLEEVERQLDRLGAHAE